MDLDLKGKKALVLGSSSGIGRAIAQALVREGAQVALSARREETLAEAAKAISAHAFIAADLSKAGESRALVNKAIAKLGGLDILVLNAGGPNKGTFADITEGQWHQDFQSLWMSVVEALQTALPLMKEKKHGRILLITSLAAKEPLAGMTTSNSLRAGLTGLTKSVSSEVAPYGITINALLPGYTNTERLKELGLTQDTISKLVPAGRLAEPSEIGDLAAFLSSSRASYITGQAIAIDGGAIRGH